MAHHLCTNSHVFRFYFTSFCFHSASFCFESTSFRFESASFRFKSASFLFILLALWNTVFQLATMHTIFTTIKHHRCSCNNSALSFAKSASRSASESASLTKNLPPTETKSASVSLAICFPKPRQEQTQTRGSDQINYQWRGNTKTATVQPQKLIFRLEVISTPLMKRKTSDTMQNTLHPTV